MALKSAVDEDDWVVTGGGSNSEGYSSTFQRKGTDGVYVTKLLTVAYIEVWQEKEQRALTLGACTDYITANPTYALNYSRDGEYTGAYTLKLRTSTKTNYSYTLVDVEEPPA